MKKLYHLSEENLDGRTLSPRVPKNSLTSWGVEENGIPRISFCPSVSKCLIAISRNIEGKEFYVHTIDTNKTDVNKVSNNIQHPSEELVPDVRYTHEVWVKTPVVLKMIGKIKVLKSDDMPIHKFTIDTPGGTYSAELAEWKYKKINP